MVYSPKRYAPSRAKRRNRERFWSKLLTRLRSVLGRKRAGRVQPPIGLVGVAQPGPTKQRKFSPAKALLPLALLAVCILGWGVFQFLDRMNIFRVTDLRLSGARTITERQVLELTGLRQGINLLTFNSSVAEKKITAHPWVDEVRIKKQWPSGVLVELREFAPFALINQADETEHRLRYLDYSGHVIADVQGGGTLDLPVINGVQAEEIADGRLAPGSKAAGALQLLHFAARGNALLPLQSVSEVRITKDKGLALYLVDHPFPIYFREGRLQSKFNDLLQILKKLYDSGEISQVTALEMVYGGNSNKMLCRFVQH